MGVISCMAAALMAVLPAEACGPYFSVIPTPQFFVWPVGAGSEALLERKENLRLWQQITSPTIPASHISKVLYVDECYDPQRNPDNLFYAYIRSANDQEVKQFLHVAKMLECRRRYTCLPSGRFWYPLDGFNYRAPDTELVSLSLDEMRRSSERNNEVDYSVLSFRLMNTLTSSQLINVKHSIAADRPLYRHLRRYARTDAPYIDEIIGTLALREERYARAVRYLAGVPQHYLATLNIYEEGHLNGNPFCLQPSMWHVFDSIASPLRAKYHFACRMHHYQKLMRHGRTPNERGLARLKYAIARRNSLEDCWALTQYWRGCVPQLFTPEYDAVDLCLVNRFPELYDYETTVGCEATQTVFGREVKAAMAMLTTDAARAEAEHMLFHLKTIIRRYPHTPAAREVKSSCDRWRHWI